MLTSKEVRGDVKKVKRIKRKVRINNAY